jgi:hypothetical protein
LDAYLGRVFAEKKRLERLDAVTRQDGTRCLPIITLSGRLFDSIRTYAIVGVWKVIRKPPLETMTVSEVASALSRFRWEKAGKRARARVGEELAKARKRIPKAKRKELASNAASSISPEAASERARKAWETKRRKKNEKTSAA